MQHPHLVVTMEALQRHPRYIKRKRAVPNPRQPRFRLTGYQHSHTSDSTIEITDKFLTYEELKEVAKSLGRRPSGRAPKAPRCNRVLQRQISD